MEKRKKIDEITAIIDRYAQEAAAYYENSQTSIFCYEVISFAHIIRSIIAMGDSGNYMRERLLFELTDLRRSIRQEFLPSSGDEELPRGMIEDVNTLKRMIE